VKVISRVLAHDPETRLAPQRDTPEAVPPMERRDRMEEVLIDDDIATLKHHAQEGMAEQPCPGRPRRVSRRN
jgi:hypothetical protein